MIRNILCVTVMLTTAGLTAYSQKQIEKRDQTWFGYFNQTRLTKRSGVWIDLHHRRTGDFVDDNSISIARLGYTYYLADQVRVTVGHAIARQYSNVVDLPNTTEQRPWQQIQWIEKRRFFLLNQYFRIEERYRPVVVAGEETDDYHFNWRFRYNVALTFPLKGKSVEPKSAFIFFNDEIHINAGERINTNYFDQNRLFLGFGYQFTKQLNGQVGYLYVFQQLPVPNQFIHINALRLFIFHTLDLRKTE
jgi:hypothetical protein